MPHYYHQSSYHKQARFIRKLRYILLLLIAIALFAAAYLFFTSRSDQVQSNIPSQPSKQTTAIFSAPVEFFSTQYFQFQGSKRWTFIASESANEKFVYRYMRGTLIEHELAIYVNQPQLIPDAAMVLPVTVESDNTLKAGPVSGFCRDAPNLKNITSIHRFTLSEVEFTCNPDSTAYTVAIGQKGAGVPMTLTRADGAKAAYGIIYKNLTAKPDTQEITELLNSFQAR